MLEFFTQPTVLIRNSSHVKFIAVLCTQYPFSMMQGLNYSEWMFYVDSVIPVVIFLIRQLSACILQPLSSWVYEVS